MNMRVTLKNYPVEECIRYLTKLTQTLDDGQSAHVPTEQFKAILKHLARLQRLEGKK